VARPASQAPYLSGASEDPDYFPSFFHIQASAQHSGSFAALFSLREFILHRVEIS
jgi:hypothetical protein